ncbi:hypothetical protein ACFL35_01850 [Candidatus Riflebacteria bacterium]
MRKLTPFFLCLFFSVNAFAFPTMGKYIGERSGDKKGMAGKKSFIDVIALTYTPKNRFYIQIYFEKKSSKEGKSGGADVFQNTIYLTLEQYRTIFESDEPLSEMELDEEIVYDWKVSAQSTDKVRIVTFFYQNRVDAEITSVFKKGKTTIILEDKGIKSIHMLKHKKRFLGVGGFKKVFDGEIINVQKVANGLMLSDDGEICRVTEGKLIKEALSDKSPKNFHKVAKKVSVASKGGFKSLSRGAVSSGVGLLIEKSEFQMAVIEPLPDSGLADTETVNLLQKFKEEFKAKANFSKKFNRLHFVDPGMLTGAATTQAKGTTFDQTTLASGMGNLKAVSWLMRYYWEKNKHDTGYDEQVGYYKARKAQLVNASRYYVNQLDELVQGEFKRHFKTYLKKQSQMGVLSVRALEKEHQQFIDFFMDLEWPDAGAELAEWKQTYKKSGGRIYHSGEELKNIFDAADLDEINDYEQTGAFSQKLRYVWGCMDSLAEYLSVIKAKGRGAEAFWASTMWTLFGEAEICKSFIQSRVRHFSNNLGPHLQLALERQERLLDRAIVKQEPGEGLSKEQIKQKAKNFAKTLRQVGYNLREVSNTLGELDAQ